MEVTYAASEIGDPGVRAGKSPYNPVDRGVDHEGQAEQLCSLDEIRSVKDWAIFTWRTVEPAKRAS